MIAVALVDNGSLEPAATLSLRRLAAAVAAQTGKSVAPVSWKHSDRVPPDALGPVRAQTLRPWLEAKLAAGLRRFVFLPCFISDQGAIGTALADEVAAILAPFPPARAVFARGVSAGPGLADMVVARIRECRQQAGLRAPAVIVVDHGGPSPKSAAVRDRVAAEARARLGDGVAGVTAASMEGRDHAHARPFLADVLRDPGLPSRDVIVALLFLSPGRHAGPGGDIAQICAAAEQDVAGLRCHRTEPIGTHPLMTECLVDSLQQALCAFASSGPA